MSTTLERHLEYLKYNGTIVEDQDGPICWAHACATVIHEAGKRVLGHDIAPVQQIRQTLLDRWGVLKGRHIEPVLEHALPMYNLRSREISENEARSALFDNKFIIATFALDKNRWIRFSDFFMSNEHGVLRRADLEGGEGGIWKGHAVVLTRANERYMNFKNSWGEDWGNGGYFTIGESSDVELKYPMRFWDITWDTRDLPKEIKDKWHLAPASAHSPFDATLGYTDSTSGSVVFACPQCGKNGKSESLRSRGVYQASCPDCDHTFNIDLSDPDEVGSGSYGHF